MNFLSLQITPPYFSSDDIDEDNLCKNDKQSQEQRVGVGANHRCIN